MATPSIARCAIGLLLLLSPRVAAAQTNSSLVGTASDGTGAILPGVTVEASSPALIEQSRTTVTDGTGQYRILELRPGTYTVTFTLPGFNTVRREGIELTTNFTATINVELRVGAVEETVIVSAASPLVDLQNVVQQRVMTRDVLDAVPTGKTFANVAVLVPGVTTAGLGRAADVGGSEANANNTLSIHGSRSYDQIIMIDSMNTGAAETGGGGTMWMAVPDSNVEEINVGAGSHSAESEVGGVRINIIPKSGGNAFQGVMIGSYASEHFQSKNLSDDLIARGLPAANRIKYLSDVNPSIGGPIARNRLWFYGGYRSWRTVRYNTLYPDANRNDWVYTRDLGSGVVVDDQLTWNASGRLTWQASARNKISSNFIIDRRCDCHSFSGILEPLSMPDAGARAIYPTNIAQVTWTSPRSNRLLLEAGFSAAISALDEQPTEGATGPPAVELSTGLQFRARSSSGTNEGYPNFKGRNFVMRAAASYSTSSHSFRFGVVANPASVDLDRRLLGDYVVVLLNGAPSRVEYVPMPFHADEELRKFALYAQDQWTVRRLTVNAGIRFDRFHTFYADVHLPPTAVLPERNFAGADVLKWNDFSPRFGVAYDLFGNGKTALKASLNRYVQMQSTDGLTRAIHPAVTSAARNPRDWTDLDGDFVADGDPLNPLGNGELGPSTNANFGKPVLTLAYDPSTTTGFGARPHNWEVSAGIQHELLPRVSLNANYVRRTWGSLTVIDNLPVSAANYDPFCITSPRDPRLPDGGGAQICGLYDVTPSLVGANNRLQTLASNYGRQIDFWQGVDLAVDVRLPRGVLLQGGTSTGRQITDNCDVVRNLDNPSPLYCRREPPFLTQVKLLGSYTFPAQVQVAATFQSVPGNLISANYVARNAEVAPSLGRNLSTGPNGTVTVNLVRPGALLTDRINQLDLRFARPFAVGRARLKAMVDVYNTLNANPVLSVNNTFGTNGASWLVPLQLLQGRFFKLGIQFNF
jgi:hypothetical protein